MARTIKFNSGSTSPLWNRRVGLAGSAASGALTASVAPNNTWGTAGAGTLGITIVSGRSNRQCAPDSIRFMADLSAATFDTPARWVHPGGDFEGLGTQGDLAHPAFDARLHDLLFFWDFGYDRTYQWTQTGNVLGHWTNARTAMGPFVSHVFTVPGFYTVSLTAVELSSGKIATATTDPLEIKDPDAEYPGAQTICVYPDGETPDLPAHLSGAQTVTASNFGSDRINNQSDALPLRWLLKRGGSYNLGSIRVWPNRGDENGAPDFYMGAYGDEADPLPVVGPADKQFRTTNFETIQDFRLVDLDIDGKFDLATGNLGTANSDPGNEGLSGIGNTPLALENDPVNFVASGCKIRRWYGPILNSLTKPEDPVVPTHWHFDDCSLTEFRARYLILSGQRLHPDTSFCFTGNYYVGSEHLPAQNDLTEAILRLETWQYTYLAKNDLHTPATTNALMKLENTPVDPSGFDLTNATTAENSGPWIHGRVFNICNNTMEGQRSMITNCRTMKQGGGAQNGIIDGNIFISGPEVWTIIETGGQGITIRNNLMWVPNTPALAGTMDEFIEIDRFTYEGTSYDYNLTLDNGDPYYWHSKPWPGMAPIRIYNNTMIFERTTDSMSAITSGRVGYEGRFDPWPLMEAIFFENNVYHAPNLSTPVIVSGLDTSTYLPFKPHYVGPKYWDYATQTHTPPQPGNPYAINDLDIPTFAAPETPLGSVVPNVTPPSVPQGEVWAYANPSASIKAGDERQPGAWLNGWTPPA